MKDNYCKVQKAGIFELTFQRKIEETRASNYESCYDVCRGGAKLTFNSCWRYQKYKLRISTV